MSALRLACQEQLLPGDSLQQKWAFALTAGFDSIELRGKSTPVDVYSVTLPGRLTRRTDGDVGTH